MANYLILCVGTAQNATIEPWLSTADGASTDLLKFFVSDKNTCYYLANHGKKDTTTDGGIFKGYVIDHDRSQILYSGNGAAPNVHWPMTGSYIRVQQDLEDIVVGNDFFAQLPLLYFRERGIVAISDSVFMLTEVRKRLGIANRIHTDAALSRAWVHGMASHPLGTSTLIDGVEYCPPGAKIRINVSGSRQVSHIEKVLAEEYFSANIADYRGTILQAAQRAASVIAAITQIPETQTSLSLSGGIDSRVCLATALEFGNKNSLFFKTNPASKDDFVVAKKLSERFNFEFKDPTRANIASKESISSWFLSCAGIYDPLTGGGPVYNKNHFRITGVGAETCKGYFGWRPLSAIKPASVGYVSAVRPGLKKYKTAVRRSQGGLWSILPECPDILISIGRVLSNKSWVPPKATEDISEAAYREAAQGLHAVGIGAEDKWASEWHYLCFMNSIHGGRSTMNSLLDVSPLLQHTLVGLSRSSVNEYPASKVGSPSIITDLLIALNPALASIPFDEQKKNLAPAYVAERSKFLGRVTSIEPYTIVGEPSAVNSGTPRMFLTLVRERGFTGQFTPAVIKQIVMQGYEAIPSEIRHAYDIPKYLVENELPEQISPSSWQCKAAGKIMAFLLAD